MARSIEQIYQEILLAKDAEPSLRQELTTKTDNRTAASRTAIWQLWCYVFAVVAHSFERLWDIFKQDINDIIDARRLGTPDWYVTISQDFQYSAEDSIEFKVVPETGLPDFVIRDTGVVSDNDDFRIIKRASFRESRGDGLLQLKVAKEDSEGKPIKLEEDELSTFANYIDRIKFAGTYIQILSTEGDKMTYEVDIYIDTTISRSLLEVEVREALENYTANIPFDGTFLKNELIEQLRDIDGVEDVVFRSIQFSQFNFTDENLTEDFTTPVEYVEERNYQTSAGYIDLQDDDSIVNFIALSEAIIL